MDSIYAITDKGILNRLDARTGEMQKRKRIGGNFSASPLLAAGQLYLASREGVVSGRKLRRRNGSSRDQVKSEQDS